MYKDTDNLKQNFALVVVWGNCWANLRHHSQGEPNILNLPTSFMEQIPSWEANRFSVSQEISRILLSPKVHFHIHKCPPPVLILNQIDPVHAPPPSHFLNIYINIILPSTPGSYKSSISLRFPHQKPVYTSSLPHTYYMLHFEHHPLVYLLWNISAIRYAHHLVIILTCWWSKRVVEDSLMHGVRSVCALIMRQISINSHNGLTITTVTSKALEPCIIGTFKKCIWLDKCNLKIMILNDFVALVGLYKHTRSSSNSLLFFVSHQFLPYLPNRFSAFCYPKRPHRSTDSTYFRR